MVFSHIIGKSTFTYGFTVPKSMHRYFPELNKGEKRKISLIYDRTKVVYAWLKKVNNSYGHLQIRYDGLYAEEFRSWLKKTFIKSLNSHINLNEYFQVQIIDLDSISIIPYPLTGTDTLCFTEIITHKIGLQSLLSDDRFIEIVESVRNIPYEEFKRQSFYNSMIQSELIQRGWMIE